MKLLLFQITKHSLLDQKRFFAFNLFSQMNENLKIWTENIVRTTIKVLSACYTWLLKSKANDNILLDFM